jgi:serine/threonine protein kinase
LDTDVPFERIGGYRILRRLATGGTSDVLLARAEGPHGFERTVVLKLLLQQFRRDAPMEKMFAREAAAYARLSHPAIVKLYDFFSAEGQLVMVLEYIDGLPLNRFRAMLRKNGEQIDDRAAIFIASRVFASLAAAHGARDPESGEFAPVIHRDVNPSNILIPWDGHVKLADFGIAKVAGVTSDTQAGFIKGTYGYMAPEQVRGEPVTIRTDVYAASLLLWELLARRKAIQRGALPELEVLRAMAEPSLPSLDVLRPDLPQRLRDALARGLEASPDARSVTAEEMLIVLRESVTSNEGRNVLAEALGRVRQDVEAARSASAPPAAPSADITSKVAAQSAAPPAQTAPAPQPQPAGPVPVAPPAAPPRPTPRKATDTGDGRRTSSSSGFSAPSGAILGRVVPASTRTPGSKPQAVTLALGSLREEALGTYSAVASSGRPISEERTSRPMIAVAAPAAASPPEPAPASEAALLSAVVNASEAADLPSMPPGHAANGHVKLETSEGAPLVGQPVVNVSDTPPSLASDLPDPGSLPAPAPIINVGDQAEPPPTEGPRTVPTPMPMELTEDASALEALSSREEEEPELPAPALPVQSGPPPMHIAAMLASTLPSIPSSTRPAPPTPLPPLPVGGGMGKGTYILIGGAALLAVAVIGGALALARPASPVTVAVPSSARPAPSVVPSATAVAVTGGATAGGAPTPSSSAEPANAAASSAPSAGASGTASSTPASSAAPAASASAPAGSGAAATSAAAVIASATTPAIPSAPPPAVSSPSPAASAAAPVVSAEAPSTAPAPSAPSIAATDGQIVTPPQAAGHRVFVDGKYAGDSPGPVVVRCGQHTVKIGSNGVPHTLDIPCGGEVSVSPH